MRWLTLPWLYGCSGLAPCDFPTGDFQLYVDLDHDNHGDLASPVLSCGVPVEAATTSDDCDDADGSRWQRTAGYLDADGDGYGAGAEVLLCGSVEGYVDQAGDCDDSSSEIYPSAPVECGDGIDQNCDGATDCEFPVGQSAISGVASTRIEGDPGSAFGASLASGGDFDGDGFLDIAIGAPHLDPWGGAFVVYGPFDPVESPDAALRTDETDAEAPRIEAGSALLVFDATGDGSVDLLVGAGSGDHFVYGHAAFIASPPFASSSVLNDGATAFALLSTGADTLVSSADLCGDETPDLLTGGGGSITLYCSPITEGGEAEVLAKGAIYSDTRLSAVFGDVVTTGDFNGDGAQDVAAGVPDITISADDGTPQENAGAVYLFTSVADFRADRAYTFNELDDLVLFGDSEDAAFGTAVSCAGDLDLDGYADLYVGAPGGLDPNGIPTGAVHFFSGAAAEEGSAAFSIYGERAGDEFGAEVTGSAPLVVGAPGAEDDAGSIAFWNGSPVEGDTLSDASYRVMGDNPGDRIGSVIVSAGDLNGMGSADFLIGAPEVSTAWILSFDRF